MSDSLYAGEDCMNKFVSNRNFGAGVFVACVAGKMHCVILVSVNNQQLITIATLAERFFLAK